MPKNLASLLRLAFRNGHASAFAQMHFPSTTLDNPEGHVAHFTDRVPLHRRMLRRARGVLLRFTRWEWQGIAYDLAYATGYVQLLLETIVNRMRGQGFLSGPLG